MQLAAADGQIGACHAFNGIASEMRPHGFGKIQGEALVGSDMERCIRVILQIQKGVVSAHGDIVLHIDEHAYLRFTDKAFSVAQIDPHILQVAIEVQDSLVIPHKVVALIVGNAAPHGSVRVARGDVLAAVQRDRP